MNLADAISWVAAITCLPIIIGLIIMLCDGPAQKLSQKKVLEVKPKKEIIQKTHLKKSFARKYYSTSSAK